MALTGVFGVVVFIASSLIVIGLVPLVVMIILAFAGKLKGRANYIVGIMLLALGLSGLALGVSFTAVSYPKEPNLDASMPKEALALPIATTTDAMNRSLVTVRRNGIIAVDDNAETAIQFQYPYESIDGFWVYRKGELKIDGKTVETSESKSAEPTWGDTFSTTASASMVKSLTAESEFRMPKLGEYLHREIIVVSTAEIASPQLTQSKNGFFNEKKELTNTFQLYVVTADEMLARKNHDAWNNRWNPLNYWWAILALAAIVFGVRNMVRFRPARHREMNPAG